MEEQKKAERLHNLVDDIKETLKLTNIAQITDVDKKLAEIWDKDLWKSEQDEATTSKSSWLSQSGIPLSTSQATKRVRAYKGFIKKSGYDPRDIWDISTHKKIALLKLPSINDEWIAKARFLSQSDLKKEIKEALDEEEEEKKRKCPCCGRLVPISKLEEHEENTEEIKE